MSETRYVGMGTEGRALQWGDACRKAGARKLGRVQAEWRGTDFVRAVEHMKENMVKGD